MKTLPLSEVKTGLSKLVDEVVARQDRVVITKHGRPAAMLMSIDEIESLEATLDIMRDPVFYSEILEAIKEADAGKTKWVDLDDLDENFERKKTTKRTQRSRRSA